MAGILVLAGGSAANAQASPRFIPLGEVADAPIGFVEMCARDEALCATGLTAPPSSPGKVIQAAAVERASDTAPRFTTAAIGAWPPQVVPGRRGDDVPAAAAVHDDAGRMALIQKINSQVNRQVIEMPDIISAGVDDRWNRAGEGRRSIGDCEDIAIEKRARLIEAGFDPDRLFLVVVYHRRLGLHTILAARLDDGDYVLDSMNPRVLAWNEPRYVWLRVQTPGDPLRWRRILRADPPTLVTANMVVGRTGS